MNSLPRFSKLLFYNNKGTALGAWCALVQTWQSLTFSSTSRSIPGQHTNDLASAFTRHNPGWHSCNISDNCLFHLLTSSCITWPLLPKIPQHQFDALFFVCCFFLLPISTAILCDSLFVGIRMYWQIYFVNKSVGKHWLVFGTLTLCYANCKLRIIIVGKKEWVFVYK